MSSDRDVSGMFPLYEFQRQSVRLGGAGWLLFQERIDLLHVVPRFLVRWDPFVATDSGWSGVVARNGETHVALVPVEELAQVACAAEDVLARIEGVEDIELFGNCRHQLHQALGADARNGER